MGVLVVEDNSITRKVLRVSLKTAGYTVREAQDGRSALELAEAERPDLVLLDLMLPDMDGFTVLDGLRALPAGDRIPILAVSGFVPKMEQARIQRGGFDDYITKPVEPSRLIQIVQTFLPRPMDPREAELTGDVLLVDDDALQRKLARIRLTELGLRVVTAEDGSAALRKLELHVPDVVVSDVLMPRLDGFGLCRAIRERPELAHLPIVLASSTYVDDKDREFAERVGANAMVVRTPDLTDVLEAVRKAFRGELASSPVSGGESLTAEHVERLMQQLERQAAVNVRLSQQCAIQAAELAVLSGMTDVVATTRGVESSLHDILASCLDAAGLSVGALYILTGDERLRPVAWIGYEASAEATLAGFFGMPELLHEVVHAQTSIVIPSSRIPPPMAEPILAAARATSALLVPIRSRGKSLGALVLMGTSQRDISAHDWLTFAEAVATQIGHAVVVGREFRRNELILDSAGEGIYGVDMKGRVTFMNPAAAAMLGYPVDELLGRPVHALIHHTRADGTPYPAAECEIDAAGRDGEVHHVDEDRYWRKDGSTVPVECTSTPVRELDRITGAVVVFRDITARKQAEDEVRRQRAALLQTEKLAAMGTLLAGVAHELNNPLSVVLGQVELLRQTAPSPLVVTRAEKIAQAGERCARIVRNFLALARQHPPERHRVSLNQVVDQALELLAYPLRVDGVEVVRDLDPELPTLQADPHQLHQVLVNLISNAHHAMRETPAPRQLTVRTRADRDARRVALDVGDSGPGIPPAVASRIFDPFFTTKPAGQGTGLGLSLCQGIVESHHGTMRVETGVAKGTTFRVELPLGTPELRVEKRTPRAVAAEARGKTILVVDDEADVAFVLAELLRLDGNRVETAANGRAALERLAAEPFDLVMSDVKMPEMDGVGLYRELVRREPGWRQRFVLLTGDTLNRDTANFLEVERMPSLNKPFLLEEVRRVVTVVSGAAAA